MVPARTLRCANAMLYAGFTLIVWAAAGYVSIFRDCGLYGYIGAAAAAVLTLLWGGYYMTLRYEIDAEGVTRHRAGRSKRILWADLTRAELRETHTQEIANSMLVLETPDTTMVLGSDVLPLESVRDLGRDLADNGILTAPLPFSTDEN